jgi:hypothetical protein
MATTISRKRFITKREDEYSDEEVIIELSDEDSVTISDTSSDDEPVTRQPEKPVERY